MEAVSSYRTTENVSNPRTYYIPRPVVCQKKSYLILKRAFDLIFSFLGILILLIPMALIALLVVLDSPGNPIFKQERLGKDGVPFQIYKFRSMHRQRIVFKIKHSKTISSLGKFPKNQLTPNGLPAHQIKQNTKDKLSQAKAGISPLHAKPQ